jgi:hypothetical protein
MIASDLLQPACKRQLPQQDTLTCMNVKLLLLLVLAVCTAAPCVAQERSPDGDGDAQQTVPEPPPASDPYAQPAGSTTPDNAAPDLVPLKELTLPIDDTLKVTVVPVIRTNVVDRVVEPCTVQVKAAGAAQVQVFVVPVDSPYGGRAVDSPRSIGTDANPADGFSVRWTGTESAKYMKVFAVAQKGGRSVRSATVDVGIGGKRLRSTPGQP